MFVSIIIPRKNKKDDIIALRQDIQAQNCAFSKEIITIVNVSPSGNARNQGAAKASGDILVFLDNDIRFGHKNVLKNMIQLLTEDQSIGICGVSQKIPLDSNKFQNACAKQISHTEHPVVDKITDKGMVAGACCAVRRSVFEEAGKFNDHLVRGVDGEFCHRIKLNSYRVVLTPQTWIYHPPPKDLGQFIKITFRNARATAFVDRHYPELNFDIGTDEIAPKLDQKSKLFRLKRFLGQLLQSLIRLKWLLLIDRLVHPIGYIYEYLFGGKSYVR